MHLTIMTIQPAADKSKRKPRSGIQPAAVADINRARKIAIWMGSLDRDLMMLTLFLLFINLASI